MGPGEKRSIGPTHCGFTVCFVYRRVGTSLSFVFGHLLRGAISMRAGAGPSDPPWAPFEGPYYDSSPIFKILLNVSKM